MSELTVLLHPDPRLKKICIPVTNIDKSIKKLCLDMIETMYKYSGVGLAASQVGILKRVVVMDCSEDCLLYTSPSPRDVEESRMPSSA